jgi:hypothetical protein
MFEGLACGLYSLIHVSGIGFCDLTDLFAGGWINCCEGSAGFARDPLVIDQELQFWQSNLHFTWF